MTMILMRMKRKKKRRRRKRKKAKKREENSPLKSSLVKRGRISRRNKPLNGLLLLLLSRMSTMRMRT
jgi:hypothetical protein